MLINPFNVDGFVAAIRTALDMPMEERKRRMRRMRRQLHDSTIFDWLESILAKSGEIMHQQSNTTAHA
ncbi:Glycosyltransferase family 20 [compost metagenome]